MTQALCRNRVLFNSDKFNSSANQEVSKRNWQLNASEFRQVVIEDVQQFIGEQKVFDDITLLVLKQQ